MLAGDGAVSLSLSLCVVCVYSSKMQEKVMSICLKIVSSTTELYKNKYIYHLSQLKAVFFIISSENMNYELIVEI